MRLLLISTILIQLLFLKEAFCQVKLDYNWILGYPSEIPAEDFGGVRFDFEYNKVNITYFNTICDASEPAVLSTPSGRLLAYANGCNIYNGEHEIMENGDSISFGLNWITYCDYGYPGTQNNLLLPFPGDTN